MNIKNLITTLVLGSTLATTAATASAAGFKLPHFSAPHISAHISTPKISVRAPAVHVNAPARLEPARVERVEPARVVERPIVRGERPIAENTIIERSVIERPIYRPIINEHFHERFFAYSPVIYDETPIIIDSNYTGNAFPGGVMIVQLNGAVGNVELDTLGGSTYVNRVVVQYSDGSTQTMPVDHYVDRANPAIDLTANGRPISAVMIYGSGAGVSVATV